MRLTVHWTVRATTERPGVSSQARGGLGRRQAHATSGRRVHAQGGRQAGALPAGLDGSLARARPLWPRTRRWSEVAAPPGPPGRGRRGVETAQTTARAGRGSTAGPRRSSATGSPRTFTDPCVTPVGPATIGVRCRDVARWWRLPLGGRDGTLLPGCAARAPRCVPGREQWPGGADSQGGRAARGWKPLRLDRTAALPLSGTMPPGLDDADVVLCRERAFHGEHAQNGR